MATTALLLLLPWQPPRQPDAAKLRCVHGCVHGCAAEIEHLLNKCSLSKPNPFAGPAACVRGSQMRKILQDVRRMQVRPAAPCVPTQPAARCLAPLAAARISPLRLESCRTLSCARGL